MWSKEVTQMIITGIGETLYMSIFATLFAYIIGIPMGIILTMTDKNGISPKPAVYSILDFIVNLIRSIPFLIGLMVLIPVTRFLVGKSYGPTAAIVPLVFCAAPFVARLVETSLKEVDAGVVEAAKSMGASNFSIITRVLLVEARTSLVAGATTAFGTIFGYASMAGVVGAGGLGDIAIRYGYYRYQADIMLVCLILLILLVQIFQATGMKITKVLDKRAH